MNADRQTELQQTYGPAATFQEACGFVFVHMDQPSLELQAKRAAEFNPAGYFCEGCPLCDQVKKSGIIVFDDSTFNDDTEED